MVVISPVSTPQKLQQIAGMTAPPRVFNTFYTTMHGGLNKAHQKDGKPEEVQVGEVGWDELIKITNEAEYDDWLFVFVDGKIRIATMIKSFKNGDKHEGEQDVGGGIQDANTVTSPWKAQTDRRPRYGRAEQLFSWAAFVPELKQPVELEWRQSAPRDT